MKLFRLIHAAMIPAIIVGIMVSCVKINGTIEDFDVELAFEPAIFSPVKVEAKGLYPKGVDFGVTASMLDASCVWAKNFSEAESFLVNEEVEQVGNMWMPLSRCNWPDISKTLTIIAYSPYSSSTVCNFTDGVVFNGVNTVEKEEELLYTEPLTDLHKDIYGGVVSVPFKQALCSVGVKVKNLIGLNEKIEIYGIRFNGIRYEGNFHSLPYPSWDLTDSKTNLQFYNGVYESTQYPVTIGNSHKVIPQTLNGVFEVDFRYYTESGTFLDQTVSTRTVETCLEPGRNYSYTLSVGIDEVRFLLEVIDSQLK